MHGGLAGRTCFGTRTPFIFCPVRTSGIRRHISIRAAAATICIRREAASRRRCPGGTSAGTAVYDGRFGPADVSNAGGLSPYGTMGQGGNLWEWTESAYDGLNNSSFDSRAIRGGYYRDAEDFLRSSFRLSSGPSLSNFSLGLRVANVPEPSTMVLLIVPALVWLLKRLPARSL